MINFQLNDTFHNIALLIRKFFFSSAQRMQIERKKKKKTPGNKIAKFVPFDIQKLTEV